MHLPKKDKSKIKVLCITGAARSGSTILGNILGQYAGFFTVGETHQLWTANLVDQRLCGCGKKLADCEIWSDVFSTGFQGLTQVDFNTIQTARDNCSRTRSLLLSYLPILKHQWESNRTKYLNSLERLYLAIQKSTGCKVIVDTSKLPIYGYLLLSSSLVEPYIVHLVRDPRATAHSWSRRKSIRTAKGISHMPYRGVLRSAIEWNTQNTFTEILKVKTFPKVLSLLYEDFVSDPEGAIGAISRFVGEPVQAQIISPAGEVRLNVTHTVVGNPNRFETGNVTLKPDNEWQSKMPVRNRAIITLLTWPLLLHYHYPLNSMTSTSSNAQ